jgi:hypothetical protein
MTTIGWRATVIAAIALAALVAGAEERSGSGDGGKSARRGMRGTVKSIDRVTGEMSITVPGSDDEITVRLPPSELSGFSRGDEVDLSMDLGKSRAGDDRPAEKK